MPTLTAEDGRPDVAGGRRRGPPSVALVLAGGVAAAVVLAASGAAVGGEAVGSDADDPVQDLIDEGIVPDGEEHRVPPGERPPDLPDDRAALERELADDAAHQRALREADDTPIIIRVGGPDHEVVVGEITQGEYRTDRDAFRPQRVVERSWDGLPPAVQQHYRDADWFDAPDA